MQTVDNAGLVLRKSWTVKLSVLATLLELVGAVWPLAEKHVAFVIEPHVFHIVAAICVAAIPVARVIKQGSLP